MSNSKHLLVAKLFFLIGSTILVATPVSAADRAQYATFDFPGAVSTAVWGINNHGAIVGSYEAPAHFFHGFLYANGKFTSIDGPGAVFTQVRGINDDGDIVGTYITYQDFLAQTPGGGFHGLYQKHGGALTSLNVPGHINTIFNKITDSRVVYGCYHDEGMDDSPQASMHGIVAHLSHWPHISLMPSGTTMNVGGNEEGTRYAGMWYDFTRLRHRSYVIQHGQQVNFDVPVCNLTTPWDMNDAGEVHPDPEATSTGQYHGFLRSRNGKIATIDYPGSTSTQALAINSNGKIGGSYVDAKGIGHGFVAVPEDSEDEGGR
jgi:uncharacterized membrane protein